MSKLVRDNIPTFIKSVGKEPKYHIETKDEKIYKLFLRKLEEEVKEVKDSKDDDEFIHEMADVYEVFVSLLRFKNMTLKEVQAEAKAKRTIKGSFEKHIVLDGVEE